MELSVVILNYNVRYFLEQCIRSVQKAIESMDAEIIVIDNNSPDNSAEMMKTVFPDIHFIQNKENVGFSKANNQAVKVAKGRYICILNPDTAVSEDTFTTALEYYKKTPGIGALGVRLMDGTGNFLPESKRNLPTPMSSFLKLFGMGGKYYAENLDEYDNGEVDILVGAFMLIERKIYEEVGGFDEDYFMYGEDIDLSYKIIKAGYKNHYFGRTTVLHYKGESTKRDENYYNRFYGAMQIFYRKHFKRNMILEIMVSAGVHLAKWKNKKFQKSKTSSSLSIANYFVESNDGGLIKRIGKKLKVDLVNLPENSSVSNALIIFDSGRISYKTIFEKMSSLRNQSNRFRIRPPHTDFILGSDQSDEKGEVLTF